MKLAKESEEGRQLGYDEDHEQQPGDEVVAAGEHLSGDMEEFHPGTPSELLSPYVPPEEQNVPMISQVVGPPAYASPDPTTTAGKLVPVGDHPLADQISEDYGADAANTMVTASGGEPTTTEGEEGEAEGGYKSMTVSELRDMAAEREIEGRSDMNKRQLVAALEKSDAES